MDDKEAWVQLYIEGKGNSGFPFSIDYQSLLKKRIQELTKAVVKECEDDLRGLRYSKLSVYTPGTEFPSKEEEKLRPDMPLPDDTTAKNPLRVVAPAIVQQHVLETPTKMDHMQLVPPSTGRSSPVRTKPRTAPSSEDGKAEGILHASEDIGFRMQCSSHPACVELLQILEKTHQDQKEKRLGKKFFQAADYFIQARDFLYEHLLGDEIGSNERFLTGAMANAMNAVLDNGFSVLHMACLGQGNTHSDLSACRIADSWPKTLMVGEGKWSADNLRNATRGQIFNELLRHRLIDHSDQDFSPILLLAFDRTMLVLELAFPSKKGGKLEKDEMVAFPATQDGTEVFWTVPLLQTYIVGKDCRNSLAVFLCFLAEALTSLDKWPQMRRVQFKLPMPLQVKDEEDIENVVYYGDNVTKIISKKGSSRVYKEFCYHLREPSDFFTSKPKIIKVDQRHPPPQELLDALGNPYSEWNLCMGPFGMCVLSYDFIEGSQDHPSVKGWLMILKQVGAMHGLGYVHGDLLPRNVLFKGRDEGFVIDFDLSRKEDEPYVSGFNYDEFKEFRHKDAKAGCKMRKEHDVYSLCQMSKTFFDMGLLFDEEQSLEALIDRFETPDEEFAFNIMFKVDMEATGSLRH